jgi:membrane dipeptidase
MRRRRARGIWRNERGLTALGTEVVRRMQRLGMVIDLAHASDRAFQEVLALTASDSTPLLVSHTGSRALAPGERNLADEEAQAVATRGGMIGVSLWRRLLAVPRTARPAGFVPGTTDAYVLHYRHLAQVAGAEAIALGSDLNGMIWRPRGSAACPCGVRHLGDWPELERALVAAGLPETALAATGERLLAAWDGIHALRASSMTGAPKPATTERG